jgi:hypothetical protein
LEDLLEVDRQGSEKIPSLHPRLPLSWMPINQAFLGAIDLMNPQNLIRAVTRLASRRNYNGIKLFSEPRPVDARVPNGIGSVIATPFVFLCWFGCYIASAMRWHKCHQ